MLLDFVGCCSATVGCYWMLLDVVVPLSLDVVMPLLDVVGCCWVL